MRTIEITAAGVEAYKAMKPSQGKDLLAWLESYANGINMPVDQSKFLLDLNKAQDTALTKPTTSPLSNLFNTMKSKWLKEGFVKVVNLTPPTPKKTSKVAELEARIAELEGLLLEHNVPFAKAA